MMQTKIEGLLLKKIPYKDRDLIATILLRNGKKMNCIFYGGQGGGEKKKSSILELGHMLKIELQQKKISDDQSFYHAKEYSLLWRHKKIRLDHVAFYLTCFFLEVANKMTFQDNLSDELRESDQTHSGVFKVLSNALYFLEKELGEKKTFDKSLHLGLFLGKLLIELGVFPDREVCHLCHRSLEQMKSLKLAFDHGGYICEVCFGEEAPLSGKLLWDFLNNVSQTAYKDYSKLPQIEPLVCSLLFDYLCFQFQISKKDFLSSSMLF